METPTIPPGLTPNQILGWSSAQAQAPDSPVFEQPPPAPPPTGNPTETNSVQWAVKLEDTDIALATAPTSLSVDSVFLIDDEYMTVIDVSNIDNPGVRRATHGSDIAVHEVGAAVEIWEPPAAQGAQAGAQSAKLGKNEPRFETKREEAKREKKEEEEEDDR